MKTNQESDRFTGLVGKQFEFNAAERRCLELQLEPAGRLRREVARIELRALLEARAFAIERLGLPEDCPVKIVRRDGVPIGLEIVLPHAVRAAAQEPGPGGGQRRDQDQRETAGRETDGEEEGTC